MSEAVTTGSTGAAPSSGAPTAGTGSTQSTTAPATQASASPTTAAAASTPAPSGEPPRERWDDILNNTRTKTRAEVEAEYRQKYGWADQFSERPYEFVEAWMDQLAQHPQYGPQLFGKAARMLQSRRGVAQATNEEPQPDVPIMDANGNLTGQTYSAKQLKAWRDWDWQQKQSALDERLGPLEQRAKQFEEAQVMAQVQQQSDEFARTTLGELRQDPYFKENESKVKAALMAHPEWGDNIHRAFHHVLQTEVYPSIQRNAEGKVLDTLKTQAAGGSIRPDGAGAATPDFKKMKPEEVMRFMHEHPDIAEQYARGR